MSTNYDDLAARAERGDLVVKHGTVRRGAEAATEACARVPQELKDRVSELAEREHRTESDIVRDALAAYVLDRATG